eukprot:617414-Pelagomonas_calceolata.AAC.2
MPFKDGIVVIFLSTRSTPSRLLGFWVLLAEVLSHVGSQRLDALAGVPQSLFEALLQAVTQNSSFFSEEIYPTIQTHWLRVIMTNKREVTICCWMYRPRVIARKLRSFWLDVAPHWTCCHALNIMQAKQLPYIDYVFVAMKCVPLASAEEQQLKWATAQACLQMTLQAGDDIFCRAAHIFYPTFVLLAAHAEDEDLYFKV